MQISNAPKILFVRVVSKNLFVISKREVIVLVLDHNKKNPICQFLGPHTLINV